MLSFNEEDLKAAVVQKAADEHGVPRAKTCPVCKVASAGWHRGASACKTCAKERVKNWQLANRERHQATARNCALKRRYGIDEATYSSMFAQQDGLCAICRKAPDHKGGRLNVDHDHETSAVRGLLCRFCNLSLAWHEKYAEQAGRYLYSDKPFRLSTPTLIVQAAKEEQ